MSKIINGGLDQHQHGAKPFEQQQFGTAGVEGVNAAIENIHLLAVWSLLLLTRQLICTWVLTRRWYKCGLMTVDNILSALPVPETLTVAGALPVALAYLINRRLGLFSH